MIGRLVGALRHSIRPFQWLGNLVVYAPLVFSAHLFEPARLLPLSAGFLLLCGLSSASYLVNDALDRQRRAQTPGEPPWLGALSAGAALSILCLVGAYVLEPAFGLAATGYLLLVLAYALLLYRRPVLDVVAIAASLVVRAVGGAVLADVKISPWLYVGIGGAGLILALGRIQYEMRLAEDAGLLESEKYTYEAVEWMNRLAITFTLLVYCLYTFLAAPFGGNYSMMTTIPFAVYAAFRYRYLIYHRAGEKSPERLVLSDLPLMVDLGLWALAAVIVRNLVL